MTRKQIKDDGLRYKRMRSHQSGAKDRFFYDSLDMGEAKRCEAIEFSRAKREGVKLAGVEQHVWGCGCGCVSTQPKVASNASLPKRKKGIPTKPQKQLQALRSSVWFDRKIWKRSELYDGQH